jgi:L-ascorbate metabolism protein UlaG (beta-lactamase superfamily)
MTVLLIALILAASIYLFFKLPTFGAKARGKRKDRMTHSSNWRNGKFINLVPTPMDIPFHQMIALLHEQLKRKQHTRPTSPLKPQHPSADSLAVTEPPRITWFGHSAFLLHIQNQTILLDPMLGKAPSPIPSIGSKRFGDSLPAEITDLPHIDAVIISHDHYDHLDYPSVAKLKDKVSMFFVPLGIGAHLERWGIAPDHITELDWWEESIYHGLTIACTPARHFSGRTLTDRFATLWASWVIKADDASIFFSGDTGYGPHFKQIGDKYGPFSLTLMECGQYNEHWPNVHMMPEQTAQAHLDLRGEKIIPMHWGAFVLALHPWAEPPERLLAAAEKNGSTVLTPEIGEELRFMDDSIKTRKWWEGL